MPLWPVGAFFEEDFNYANEAETSLMLLLAPEMVDIMKKAVDIRPRTFLLDGLFNKQDLIYGGA